MTVRHVDPYCFLFLLNGTLESGYDRTPVPEFAEILASKTKWLSSICAQILYRNSCLESACGSL